MDRVYYVMRPLYRDDRIINVLYTDTDEYVWLQRVIHWRMHVRICHWRIVQLHWDVLADITHTHTYTYTHRCTHRPHRTMISHAYGVQMWPRNVRSLIVPHSRYIVYNRSAVAGINTTVCQQFFIPHSYHSRSVSTTRVHGPSWRPENSGAFFDTRQLGPWTRPVNSGSGNRPLVLLHCPSLVYAIKIIVI